MDTLRNLQQMAQIADALTRIPTPVWYVPLLLLWAVRWRMRRRREIYENGADHKLYLRLKELLADTDGWSQECDGRIANARKPVTVYHNPALSHHFVCRINGYEIDTSKMKQKQRVELGRQIANINQKFNDKSRSDLLEKLS